MDFDVAQVKEDIAKLKELVLAGKFSSLERLGHGIEGSVWGAYNNCAVVKAIHAEKTLAANPERIQELITIGAKAMERDLDFVPYLECVQKRHTYIFMPKINGVTTKKNKGLPALVDIGVSGLEAYFHNYKEGHDIGFHVDNCPDADNLIVSYRSPNIKFIDPDKGAAKIAPRKLNRIAAELLLDYWFHRRNETKETQELFTELVVNTQSALRGKKDADLARKRVEQYWHFI